MLEEGDSSQYLEERFLFFPVINRFHQNSDKGEMKANIFYSEEVEFSIRSW